MTIGIATYGPSAGVACLAALKSVEAVGRGAIRGFVSFVVITQLGELKHMTCQRDGVDGLLAGSTLPEEFAQAELAALMSSGPNRPEPLENFTVAKPGVALVTGHRMPNAAGPSGKALNQSVLDLIEAGNEPLTALSTVLAEAPDADAGFLVLTADRRMFAMNSANVGLRSDTGLYIRDDPLIGMGAGVMHNAILPSKPLACLAAETALDHMHPADAAHGSVEFRAGTKLYPADKTYIEVDQNNIVSRIFVANRPSLKGSRSIGLGHNIAVFNALGATGHMTYEPYLVAVDGILASIDGLPTLSVPISQEDTSRI
jgi:hypothetical protein